MVDDTRSGRHRNAARYNPVAELATIVKSAGETSVKASAVLAASGGLVAAFALPAQAAPVHRAPASTTTAAAAGAEVSTTTAAPAALALAPAVVAPAAAAPVAIETVGVVGVKAVAKPKPKPKPKPKLKVDRVVRAVAERSSHSSSSSSSTSSKKSASRSTTRSSNPAQSSSGVVNIARGLLGIPYVYGGESRSGFDCSGLTQYVFGKAGVSIPRTASAQQRAATRVSSPKPGDLIFWGSPAWHVAIYVGPGMMIDAAKPGTVTRERPIFSGVSGYGRF